MLRKPSSRRPAAVPAKPGAATRKALAAAEAICTGRGERLTDMRRATYLELLEAGQPVSAYDLLQRLQVRLDKPLAPPTVYRPLEFLVQQGLAHRLESTHAFVACDHPSDHHQALYLVCTACGSAEEVRAPAVEGLIAETASSHRFVMQRQVTEVQGLCGDCTDGQAGGGAGKP